MADQARTIPAAQLDLYARLVATRPGLKQKGAAMPYTSHNGHMFSFLTKSGTLGLRLPEQARSAFLDQYRTTLCEQHGIVLKEYVRVPDSLFRNTQELKPFFDVSYAYVDSLKPKAAKKRPATKKRTKR